MAKQKITDTALPSSSVPATPHQLSAQEVMLHLHDEHKYMSRLLDVLTEQVALINAGEKPDLAVMHDVALYMKEHADTSHHAKEDIIYRKLSECGDLQKSEVVSLLIDHETSSKKSEALVHSIEEAQLELTSDRQETLRLRSEDYIASLQRHMDYEESQVFPLALALLSEEDWSDIISDIQPDIDPLFGHTAEQRYENLLQAIGNSMERAAEDVVMAEWVGLGAAMENVGIFLNAAMLSPEQSLFTSNRPTKAIWWPAVNCGRRVLEILATMLASQPIVCSITMMLVWKSCETSVRFCETLAHK